MIDQAQRIMAISLKRFARPLLDFLSQVQAKFETDFLGRTRLEEHFLEAFCSRRFRVRPSAEHARAGYRSQHKS